MRRAWKRAGMMVCAAVALVAGRAAAQSNAATLGLLATADEGEIMQAQLASRNATRDDVRDYANMLVNDHTAHLQAVRDTAAGMGVTPDTTTAQARQLRLTAMRQMARLQGLSGPALDRQFLAFMVTDHAGLLAVLRRLIGQGTNPQLTPFLVATRTVVQAHLDRARALQRGGGRQPMGVHKDMGR